MRRFLCLGTLLVVLAGCSAPQQPNADRETLERVAYRHEGPPSVTLLTVINNRSGQGAHTALMVNAQERVMFDPAGSFHADVVPEYNDVLYGITPAVVRAYRGAHARSTFRVRSQTVVVTPEQANIAYNLVVNNGRVPGAYCANSTSRLLEQVPGFEDINPTMFPAKLSEQFSRIPGVVSDEYYENDSDDLKQGIAASNQELNG